MAVRVVAAAFAFDAVASLATFAAEFLLRTDLEPAAVVVVRLPQRLDPGYRRRNYPLGFLVREFQQQLPRAVPDYQPG